jgi:hypothetical protein
MKKSDIDKIKDLISFGSDVAGPVTAAAISYITGNFQGAILGSAYGAIFKRGIIEIADRILSSREKSRVGVTAAYALTKIKLRLDAGENIRDFFDENTGKRSDAEEIFEGVLLKAKNEHEEKKTKILGNIYANTTFTSEFSVGEANHLLQITENLTYQEICILALIERKDETDGIVLRKKWKNEENESDDTITLNFSTKEASVFQQAYELCNKGLMFCGNSQGDTTVLMTASDILPDELMLTIMGITFCKIMGLGDIPDEDIEEVKSCLS